MNWQSINNPPAHSNDVLLLIEDGEKYWIEAKYEGGVWKNRLGDPVHSYQLSKATKWSDVEIPELA